MMLRQNGGPLSPVNILMYIRSLNTQIGDGSQEDAHEFLRSFSIRNSFSSSLLTLFFLLPCVMLLEFIFTAIVVYFSVKNVSCERNFFDD